MGARLNAVAPGPVMTPLLQGSYDDPELGPLVDAFLPVPWGEPPSAPGDIARIIEFLLASRGGARQRPVRRWRHRRCPAAPR